MKGILVGMIAIAASLCYGSDVDFSKAKSGRWVGEGAVEAVVSDSGEMTITAKSTAKGKKNTITGFAQVPITKIDSQTNAVRFEAKGSGVDRLASVFLCERKAPIGFEAAFSLKNTKWHEVVIPLRDFCRNFRGGGTESHTTYIEAPKKYSVIAFGRGRSFHRYDLSEWRFSIRNVSFLSGHPVKAVPKTYSKGLERTLSLIHQKKPLKILMLGDSITDSGRDKTYAYHMSQKLKAKFGVECVIHNAGIGGHTTRDGRIVIQRGIAKMPDPDLITMFYGANDCWATDHGMTAKDFQGYMEALIDTARTATDGKADIMLFTGVQRLNKERTESRGVVERIVPGIKGAAASRHTAVCDTISVYAKISQGKRLEVYNDTIHPNQVGQQFIGEIMYKTIADALE